MPCLVIVQAQEHTLPLSHPLQHLHHRNSGRAAAGHIAVCLPILRVHRDVGEHINGCLEYQQAPVCAHVVEAVPRVAALHIDAEHLTQGIGAAFVGMTKNAVFVLSDEHGVVIFGIFIECPCSGKVVDDLALDATLL